MSQTENLKITFSSIKTPYTMTNLYTIDHSRITGYLENYDPIKHYFCLQPYKDTSRPIIVPQEHLIHFDDLLLSCNEPTIIAFTYH